MFFRKATRKKSKILENCLIEHQQVQLRSIASNRNEEVSFGRLLNNKKVDEEGIISSIIRRTSNLCAGRHVLSIQDTSELHYHKHGGRIKDYRGLGDAGRCPLGYFIHPSLAIDATNETILGLSDIYIWNREKNRTTDASMRKQIKIEDKESFKWIRASQSSQVCLRSAEHITIIQDRDGDIFEEFLLVPDKKTDLLIRSRADRKLVDTEESLYKSVAKQPICIKYELEITTDNKKRAARKALMEVKYCKVFIRCPKDLRSRGYAKGVELTIVHAKESPSTVPIGESPVDWKLLTTHEVANFMDAIQIIYWYSLRWLIEDFFRLLKKRGFDLESSELETGYGLRKLGLFTMQAATKVMQLRQSRNEEVEIPIKVVFVEKEQECLEDILPNLEGQSEKLKNPYPKEQLIWANWIIARLGGWSGYKSQRPPGLITLRKGLQKFNLIYLGWKINKQNST